MQLRGNVARPAVAGRGSIVSIALLVSLAACSDLHPPEALAAEVTHVSGALVQSPGRPPTLPKHSKKMTEAEMRAFLKDQKFDAAKGEESGRRECIDGNKKEESYDCQLRSVPVETAGGISLNSLENNGRLLAMIINLGKKKENVLRIPPGDTALWLVRLGWWDKLPDLLRPARSVLVSLKDPKVEFRDNLRFKACDSGHPPDTSGKLTRFQWCPPRPGHVQMLTSHLTPPWVSCVEGCCYAGDS